MNVCAKCAIHDAAPEDYLCRRCRAELDPGDWDDRHRVQKSVAAYLYARGLMYYGIELFFPEDSPWAWLRILDDPSLADPEAVVKRDGFFSSGDLLREYEKRLKVPMLVVWKHTGHIYEIEEDSTVGDDPLWEYVP